MSEPTLDPDADYQAALVAALAAARDPDDLRARLRADPRAAPFREAIEAMEPRMIEVAIALTRRWAVRAPSASQHPGRRDLAPPQRE